MAVKYKQGFTLVELAIVITIVGLLIGGVLKGQELLENARMTSLGTTVKSYEAGLTTFRDIYKGKPGDLANAPNFIQGCTVANNCVAGDGDNNIGTANVYFHTSHATQESFQFWKHLALANVIKGVDTSVAMPAVYQGGRDVPKGPFGDQAYAKTSTGNLTNIGEYGNGTTVLFSANTSGSGGGYNLSPATTQKIDLKLDDGKAFSGDAYAVSDSWNTGCGSAANGVNGYNVQVTTLCSIAFTIGN